MRKDAKGAELKLGDTVKTLVAFNDDKLKQPIPKGAILTVRDFGGGENQIEVSPYPFDDTVVWVSSVATIKLCTHEPLKSLQPNRPTVLNPIESVKCPDCSDTVKVTFFPVTRTVDNQFVGETWFASVPRPH